MQTPLSSSMVRTPLYRQAADVIRREFIDGRAPGFRLPSEVQLEGLLGVSLITVRGALRELEAEGALERRRGSGTYVAERRLSGKHAAILLDVNIASENLSSYYPKWLVALQEAFRAEGIPHRPYLGTLPLGTYPRAEITCQELLEDVRLERISAIYGIFVSQKPFWGESFVERGIPVLDATYGGQERLDFCIRSVLSHFQAQGRTRLAVLGWEHPFDGRHLLSRSLFKIAPEYGISPTEIRLATDANGWEHGMGWERIRDVWRSSTQKRDALFITDHMLFEDCQKALGELGCSIPEDLSVAVRTVDVHHFPDIRFPVFVWKSKVKSQAEAVAKAIKAILQGQPLPAYDAVAFETQMLLPEREDIGALSEPVEIPDPMNPASSRSGFTLLELLAVVAIVAVVAALLMPVVNGAIQRARTAQCVSNLRKLYAGAMAYAQDHNMEIPVDRVSPGTASSWYVPLSDYVPHGGYGKKLAPYFCPANPMKVAASGSRGWTSYSINSNLYIANAAAAKDPDYANTRRGMRFQQIYGIKAFLLDSCNGSETDPATNYQTAGDRDNPPWNFAHAVHGQCLNVLFTDGHVASPRVEPRSQAVSKGKDLIDLKAEWFFPVAN